MLREALSTAGFAVAKKGAEIAGEEIGKRVVDKMPYPPVGRIISKGILSLSTHQVAPKPEPPQEEIVNYSCYDIRLDEIVATHDGLRSNSQS